ncbi:PTS sugar transporter subunit IIB [Streptococcus iniae]|uniref:PTS sugar transporter subunit IIB n=1 Tax=Streptococcus iniae TaxID=1346 RepID=UPI0008DA8320|nr:PTS sugar transporter subunit IIB [Streptococcus iniae]OHX27404.1 PTS sugar transporter subunit IIB [Streptococcus iniae]RLV28156.1 PTS sugar transporter subunit IIB [Streptococcus iniae]
MAEKTIALICAAGMSTSLLVSKMQKAALEKGIDVEIFAMATTEADEIIASRSIDVLLLGPQVRFMLEQFKEKLEQKGVPVDVIPMKDYGMMDGAKVLMLAQKLMEGQ